MKNKDLVNKTLPEQFQKDTKSIPLTYKYMTAHWTWRGTGTPMKSCGGNIEPAIVLMLTKVYSNDVSAVGKGSTTIYKQGRQ